MYKNVLERIFLFRGGIPYNASGWCCVLLRLTYPNDRDRLICRCCPLILDSVSLQCVLISNPFFAVARKLEIVLRRGRQTVTIQLQVVACAEDMECARKHLRSFASGQLTWNVAPAAERLFPANWQPVESPCRCSRSVWRYPWQTQFIMKPVSDAESSVTLYTNVESKSAGEHHFSGLGNAISCVLYETRWRMYQHDECKKNRFVDCPFECHLFILFRERNWDDIANTVVKLAYETELRRHQLARMPWGPARRTIKEFITWWIWWVPSAFPSRPVECLDRQ
jgi:hypothetical protein